jgi:putative transposase
MRVSKNAYYHWFNNKYIVLLKTATMHLKERIKVLFKENREIYGSYRIQKNWSKKASFTAAIMLDY